MLAFNHFLTNLLFDSVKQYDRKSYSELNALDFS